VTGASGLLGAAVILAAARRHEVVAVAHGHPLRTDAIASEIVDLSERDAVAATIDRHRPEAIIHAAAMTDVDGAERDPERAARHNVTMAGLLATAARAIGARFIHVSTEAVFDGRAGPYGEEDEPHPLNVYGATKLAGERSVLDAHPDALVVRTTIYGWNAQPKTSLAEWFLARFERAEPAPGFDDAWMSPILVDDLADRLLRLLEVEVRGVLHVAGRECISKADFGRRLARAFGHDPELVIATKLADAGLVAPRAHSPCLRVDRAEALLGPMPTVDEGIARFRHLADNDHRTRLRALLGG
jgi:dTDP-4-dehydrorhamnose reductase